MEKKTCYGSFGKNLQTSVCWSRGFRLDASLLCWREDKSCTKSLRESTPLFCMIFVTVLVWNQTEVCRYVFWTHIFYQSNSLKASKIDVWDKFKVIRLVGNVCLKGKVWHHFFQTPFFLMTRRCKNKASLLSHILILRYGHGTQCTQMWGEFQQIIVQILLMNSIFTLKSVSRIHFLTGGLAYS